MSETKIQDDLIDKIMKIEDPFIRESNKLREAQKRGNRKKEPEYRFQKVHIRDSTAKIKQVMEMGLSTGDIKQEIESKRGKNEFWRTHEILDDIHVEVEKPLEDAKKRLAFMKSTQSRLGKDSLVKLRESNLIEGILSKDNPKSGTKKKKKKKKRTKKRTKKKKYKK